MKVRLPGEGRKRGGNRGKPGEGGQQAGKPNTGNSGQREQGKRPVNGGSADKPKADSQARSTQPNRAQNVGTSETILLSTQQRARLIKFVENNPEMPEAAKERMLKRLNAVDIPKRLVERLKNQMTGNRSKPNGETN